MHIHHSDESAVESTELEIASLSKLFGLQVARSCRSGRMNECLKLVEERKAFARREPY
jgi:hypothetical protein